LSLGMHTGISSASCHNPASLPAKSPYSLLKLILNGRQANLPLKAVISGAVIFYKQNKLT
jgi:hypothetical protein